MSEPLDLINSELPRRSVLGRLGAGLAAVMLNGSFMPFRERYSVSMAIPAAEKVKPQQKKKPESRANIPVQIGVDMTDLAKAGQPGTVFLARWGCSELTDHAVIERKHIVPASMQKTYTALLVLELSKQQNIYGKLADNGEPYMAAGRAPLLTLDNTIEISKTAAALNTTSFKSSGHKLTVHEAMLAMLHRSDNGAAQALAEHCGKRLLEEGYVTDDGKAGMRSRAFNIWGNQQASGYGLSPQFRMINAHGLPGYETLYDADAATVWIKAQDKPAWKMNVTTAGNPVPHFGLRNATIIPRTETDDQLPLHSGICQKPWQNNRWGLLDGVRINARLQMLHGVEYARFFEPAEISRADLVQRYEDMRQKTGTSWDSGECVWVSGKCAGDTPDSTRTLFALTAGGRLQSRTRYKRAAQILNYASKPGAMACIVSAPTAKAKPPKPAVNKAAVKKTPTKKAPVKKTVTVKRAERVKSQRPAARKPHAATPMHAKPHKLAR